MSVAVEPVEHGECRDRAAHHYAIADHFDWLSEGEKARHLAIAQAYERRAGQLPEDAKPGDECGIILGLDDLPFCPGTLHCYVDVRGAVPGCACHISPPCGSCLEAPLVCDTCDEEVGGA